MKNKLDGVFAASVAGLMALHAMGSQALAPSPSDERKLLRAVAASSVPFVPNVGQWQAGTAFAAKTFAGTLHVTAQGELSYQLPAQTLVESFVDARGTRRPVTPLGYRPAETKVGFILGSNEAAHRPSVNTYDRVNLGEVYSGINVQLRATGSNVEKIFTVAPQRDAGQIRMQISGARALALGRAGELIAETDAGPVSFTAPIAFQDAASGERTPVEVRYELGTAAMTYGFTLGAYDRARPIVIDPMLQAAYVGGSGSDTPVAITVHPRTGDVYVTGTTGSATLQQTSGAYDATLGGVSDAFVSRFSADLKTLYRTTYFGGSGIEIGQGIAIHPSNFEVYVAGNTSSTDFPLTPAFVDQSTSGGGQDAFITRLAPDLSAMRLSSYLGGSGSDAANALAIHPLTGDIYIAGSTSSSNFPATTGALQALTGGGGDAFVARVSQDFAPSTFARVVTLLGGSGGDSATALRIHPRTGDVYVAGNTSSNDFPGLSIDSAQGSKTATFAGFVAVMNRSLNGGLRSTFLTGAQADDVYALAYQGISGDIIVAGSSSRHAGGLTLPGVTGAAQAVNAGAADAFVTRISPDLRTVFRTTYLGGPGVESGVAIAVHPATGEIFLGGQTDSTTFNTPVGAEALQPARAGVSDMYVARFSADLSLRPQATYLGTAVTDNLLALALNAAGTEVLLTGTTGVTGFPGTTSGSPTSYSSGTDGVVVRLATDLALLNRTPQPVAFIPQSNVTPGTSRASNEVRLIITPTPPDNAQLLYVSGADTSEFCLTNTAGCCTTPLPACSGFATGWVAGAWYYLSGDYVAVRHSAASPSGTEVTQLVVGGRAVPFVTSTGNARIRCNLDGDADQLLAPGHEGIALLRAMLGIRGNAVVAGTSLGLWDAYRRQLNANCGTQFQ
ncbi:MAG: SBBP repeat-containing protein [Burkholderiales bacterium]|nr:SBBP repeat-containing protein [Burkholderiales bacterium]